MDSAQNVKAFFSDTRCRNSLTMLAELQKRMYMFDARGEFQKKVSSHQQADRLARRRNNADSRKLM